MASLEERVETLERRVSEWEGQVGFLIPLVRQLHREILSAREDTQHLDNKIDRLENKVDRLEAKVDRLEIKVDQGFAVMAEKFHDVDQQFRKIDQRFHGLEESLKILPRVLAEEITRRR